MNVYSFSFSIVIFFWIPKHRYYWRKFHQQNLFFLLDWGLLNLRARGRLTEFRFGMALWCVVCYECVHPVSVITFNFIWGEGMGHYIFIVNYWLLSSLTNLCLTNKGFTLVRWWFIKMSFDVRGNIMLLYETGGMFNLIKCLVKVPGQSIIHQKGLLCFS